MGAAAVEAPALAPSLAAEKDAGGNDAVSDIGWPEKLTPWAIGIAWKRTKDSSKAVWGR